MIVRTLTLLLFPLSLNSAFGDGRNIKYEIYEGEFIQSQQPCDETTEGESLEIDGNFFIDKENVRQSHFKFGAQLVDLELHSTLTGELLTTGNGSVWLHAIPHISDSVKVGGADITMVVNKRKLTRFPGLLKEIPLFGEFPNFTF